MMTSQEIKLTSSELQLIRAYRKLDDETQVFIFDMVTDSAKDPQYCRPAAPVLRLVQRYPQ